MPKEQFDSANDRLPSVVVGWGRDEDQLRIEIDGKVSRLDLVSVRELAKFLRRAERRMSVRRF